MLNHTYTSVKNANIVDCGKKLHIPSQPLPLLRNNYLGEYRTDLDRKKVLANLGIATDLSLEWEYIKGDIGRSESLIKELDSRTKYISQLDGFLKTIIQGIEYLETIVGGEEEAEGVLNDRLKALEDNTKLLNESLDGLKTYILETVDVNIDTLLQKLEEVTEKVNNITNLIQVSTKENNALVLIPEGSENLKEGETPGLYVPDLSEEVSTATLNIGDLQTNVKEILDTYVTKDLLGGGDFNFVHQDTFNQHVTQANTKFNNIDTELAKTVKTGEDGHVDTLYVNKISKNNNDENIVITDSFEVDSNIPLDVRFVRQTLEELYALPVGVCYPGMGVIVNSLSSLYILRKPLEGVKFDLDYIKNPNNWKCPEDLVIEVITQEEYDSRVAAGTINPHMFYYIHEEIIEEPNRKDFDTDEAYTEALNRWLRVLQQKYMSAVWGLEIESLVASKASNTAVKSLETEILKIETLINSLSGGTNEVSLKDLNDQVVQNRENINSLIQEEGIIPILLKDLTDLQTKVSLEYVTKEEVTTDNPLVDYIFVKKSQFEDYVTQHNKEIGEKVSTKEVNANKIVLETHTLTTKDTNLLFNDEKVALDKEIPIIELIENANFENLQKPDPNKYYYVYDFEERYVLDSEFTNYKTILNNTINTLSESINKNKFSIGDLENLNSTNKDTLVSVINELVAKITDLTNELNNLKEQIGSV